MRIRRILFDMARDIVDRDNLTDFGLSRVIYTSRPRASSLIHGHIARFNSETLIDILARLGVTIDVTVTRVVPYSRFHVTHPPPNRPVPPGMIFGRRRPPRRRRGVSLAQLHLDQTDWSP